MPARAGTINVKFEGNLATKKLAQGVIGNNTNKFVARTSNAAARVYEQLQRMQPLLAEERQQDSNTLLIYDLRRARLSQRKQFNRAIEELVSLQMNTPNANIRLHERSTNGQRFHILVTNKLHKRKKSEAKPPVTSIFAMKGSDTDKIRNVKAELNAAVQNKLRGFTEEKRRAVLRQLHNTLAPDSVVDYIAARIERAKKRRAA